MVQDDDDACERLKWLFPCYRDQRDSLFPFFAAISVVGRWDNDLQEQNNASDETIASQAQVFAILGIIGVEPMIHSSTGSAKNAFDLVASKLARWRLPSRCTLPL